MLADDQLQDQIEQQLAQDIAEILELKTIEKQIQELKDKINTADHKKTFVEKYSEYEKK